VAAGGAGHDGGAVTLDGDGRVLLVECNGCSTDGDFGSKSAST
jgi:hypothetical protein